MKCRFTPDSVAKRFSASERARSIQDRTPMRNVDSKIHPARFDRFKFLFHSFAAASFATQSGGEADAPRTSYYVRVCRVGPGNFTPSPSQVGSRTGAPV